MKRIGFKQLPHQGFPNFKRDILFFDKLVLSKKQYIGSLFMRDGYARTSKEKSERKFIDNEIEYLNKIELLDFLDESIEKRILENYLKKHYITLYEEHQQTHEKFSFKFLKRSFVDTQNLEDFRDPELYRDLSRILAEKDRTNTRILSSYLTDLEEDNSYFPILDNLGKTKLPNSEKENIAIKLVIKNFPHIDDLTDWEDILLFKEDSESQRKLLGLKNWIRKIGHSKFTSSEISEEFDYLITEYEHRIKLNKLKYKTGVFEVVVTTTLEFFENLMTLKWSKAAKTLFSLKKHNVDLLIGETKATGKELAYISLVKNKYK